METENSLGGCLVANLFCFGRSDPTAAAVNSTRSCSRMRYAHLRSSVRHPSAISAGSV